MPNRDNFVYQAQNAFGNVDHVGAQSILNKDNQLDGQVNASISNILTAEDNLRRTIENQQNQITVAIAQNKIKALLQENAELFSTDPDRFKEESNEGAQKLLDDVPAQFRQSLALAFKVEQEMRLVGIRDNQRHALDESKFEESKKAIQYLAADAKYIVPKLLSPDKAVAANGALGLAALMSDFNVQIDAKDSYAKPLFNEKQKQELRDGVFGSMYESFAELKLNSLPLDKQAAFVTSFLSGQQSISYKNQDGDEVNIDPRLLSYKTLNTISNRLAKLYEDNLKQAEGAHQLQMIENVITGAAYPDPKDKKYREAADVYYESLSQNFNFTDPLTSKQSVSLIADFINGVKTIPPKLSSDIRALLASGDFVAFSAASDIVRSVQLNKPNLIEFLPQKEIAKALTMNRMTDAGVPAETAFKQIEKSFSSMSSELIKKRAQDFARALREDNKAFLASSMTKGWFFKENKEFNGLVSDTFYQQYTGLAEEYYKMGADLKTAQEAALAVMKTRWGDSTVNGDHYLTALPPEKYYGMPGVQGKELRAVLDKYIKASFGEDAKPEEYVVLADSETYATAGDASTKPSYALCKINDMGMAEPVLDDDLQIVRIGSNIWNYDNFFADVSEEERQKRQHRSEELTKTNVRAGLRAISGRYGL